MGRFYSVQFNNINVTAQQDFFELVAPAAGVVYIHSISLSQGSDVGDAQEEGLSVLLRRGQATTGSGGTTYTPVPLEPGFGASGCTAKVNNTTKASGGTIATLDAEQWIIRAPYLHLPTPELRVLLAPGQRFTCELATTPADALTINGTLRYEEIG